MENTYERRTSLLDRPLFTVLTLNWEIALFALILVVTVFTRLYILGARVMSHDETSHVYFSWLLYQGRGYTHDPVTHGPFQFHIVALSYFLFGDSDFTARIPAALFSIATVAFAWSYRRYLGRAGALVAALMLAISPYILYYGRYVRNESFVGLYALVTLWAILRYLETGKPLYMYALTGATIMHLITKETSYIYTAQILLFLGFYLIYRVTQKTWKDPQARSSFLGALIIAVLLLGATFGANSLIKQQAQPGVPVSANAPSQTVQAAKTPLPNFVPAMLGGLTLAALIAAGYFLIAGYGLEKVRKERAFDMLLVTGTLFLPALTAFPLKLLKWSVPTNVTAVNNLKPIDMVHMGLVLGIMFILAIAIGAWWNWRQWLVNFGIFYSVFVIFYTTLFTNGAGIFTGLLGGLGYWLEQQGVQRGAQPWYYYIAVQIPVYEYLPFLGSILALVIYFVLLRRKKAVEDPVIEIADGEPAPEPASVYAPDNELTPVEVEAEEPEIQPAPVVPLFAFWATTSLLAFSYAGEKMPWLTFHITLGMILLAAWGFGQLIDSVEWSRVRQTRGTLALIVLPVFFISLGAALSAWLSPTPPFQGKELAQLQATSTFITALIAVFVSGWAVISLLRAWPAGQVTRVFFLELFAFLAILTARTAFTASFINYDQANELLVYAHCGPGIKTALSQIEEISRRTTDGLDVVVAYDDKTTYPYWWYLRDYTQQRYYGNNPTRDLRSAAVILAGDANWAKIEPVVGQAYYSFDYIRMWWPNQDYFSLDAKRILYALKDPQMRAALFQIWLNRDYKLYGQVTNKDMSLPHWQPSEHMRLYIRKDIAAQIWNYGAAAQEGPVVADPYEGKQAKLVADRIIGSAGNQPGQFTNPRNVAVAADGSLYVADSGNHRIQHLDASGNVLQVWGQFADASKGQAPGGTFNEPWGIAVGPDGSVYVSDTWNHRIQKFTADGKFVTMWGSFGQGQLPTAFWGPRGIVVSKDGHVFVADTGNKRVVVFDENGGFITQFGSAGLEAGQFDEQTGLALDADGNLYVADTWNQRVQVMSPGPNNNYTPSNKWEVAAWYSNSVENKPFIAVDGRGHVFITDPEGYRVIEFTNQGQIVRWWGDFGNDQTTFGLPVGIAADPLGGIWVVDSANARVMHFLPPEE